MLNPVLAFAATKTSSAWRMTLGVPLLSCGNSPVKGSESADLLQDRMAALDLDRGEVARREPATFQDLQRVCTMCSCHRRCARDLERDPLNAAWEDYCPNVTTLKALGVQPWAVRREW
jgi:Family of unknown function (DUF6455)